MGCAAENCNGAMSGLDVGSAAFCRTSAAGFCQHFEQPLCAKRHLEQPGPPLIACRRPAAVLAAAAAPSLFPGFAGCMRLALGCPGALRLAVALGPGPRGRSCSWEAAAEPFPAVPLGCCAGAGWDSGNAGAALSAPRLDRAPCLGAESGTGADNAASYGYSVGWGGLTAAEDAFPGACTILSLPGLAPRLQPLHCA